MPRQWSNHCRFRNALESFIKRLKVWKICLKQLQTVESKSATIEIIKIIIYSLTHSNFNCSKMFPKQAGHFWHTRRANDFETTVNSAKSTHHGVEERWRLYVRWLSVPRIQTTLWCLQVVPVITAILKTHHKPTLSKLKSYTTVNYNVKQTEKYCKHIMKSPTFPHSQIDYSGYKQC